MREDRQDVRHETSFAQQGMWHSEQLRENGSVYHMPFTLTFDGPLDRPALMGAVDALTARQPVLATAFEADDHVPYTGPAQHPPRVVPVDLASVPPGEVDAVLAEAIREEILRPFDLRQGPLARMTLFTLHATRHVLLVVVHHLVFDGESMELFGRELAAGYRAALGTPGPDQAVLGTAAADSFAAYAAQERDRVATLLPAARDYWRGRWRDPAPVSLPGLTGPPPEAGRGGAVELFLDTELSDRLAEVCGKIGVTRFEFLLASLYCLLHGYGNDIPTVTLALGLRPDGYTESIGPFAQEIPFPVPVPPDTTFQDFAAALRADLRELYRFREVPVNQAVPGIRPSAMHTPVALSYRRHARDVEFPGLRVQAEWLFNHAVRGALWIQVLDREDDLRVVLRHPPRILGTESVERIARDWRRVVERALATPDIGLATVAPAPVPTPVPTAGPVTREPAGTPPPVPAGEPVVAELTRIWREVLRVKEVGPYDNLFDFGVNSLTVSQIAARIRQRLKVDVPMESFYETPTISDIAAVVARSGRRG